MKTRAWILLIAFALLANPSTGMAGEIADWPQFRGPDGNGLCEETGLLKEWTGPGPEMLWKVDGLGKGYIGRRGADFHIHDARVQRQIG